MSAINKLVYFNEYAAAVVPARYLGVLWSIRGFSPFLTGILGAVMPCCGLVGAVVLSRLADRSSRGSLPVLIGAAVCAPVAFTVLSIEQSLWGIVPAVCVYSFLSGAFDPLVNHAVLLRLRHIGLGPEHWGKDRVAACVAWGGSGLLAGFIFTHFGINAMFPYYWCFAAGFVASLIALHRARPAPGDSPLLAPDTCADEARGGRDDPESGPVAGAVLPLTTAHSAAFYAMILAMGTWFGVIQTLLFYYLVTDLGASPFLCGLCLVITVLPELPLMHFQDRIIARLGLRGCWTVASVSFSLRLFAYSLLSPATRLWVLAIEPLHGVTFAFFYNSAVMHAHRLAPPARGGEAQAWVSGLYDGLGLGGGSLLGGFLYHSRGPVFMFQFFSLAMLLSWALFLLTISAVEWPAYASESPQEEERPSREPAKVRTSP